MHCTLYGYPINNVLGSCIGSALDPCAIFRNATLEIQPNPQWFYIKQQPGQALWNTKDPIPPSILQTICSLILLKLNYANYNILCSLILLKLNSSCAQLQNK